MTHPRTHRKLQRARDFMRDAYREPLDLEVISNQANLSPHHFLRAFRASYQETPHAFLTRLRIERAKTMLRADQDSILEICQSLGFESPSSFSGLFARHVGMSPSRYRRYARTSILVPGLYRGLYIPSCFSGIHG